MQNGASSVRNRGLSSSLKCSFGSEPTQNDPPGTSAIPSGQAGATGAADPEGGAATTAALGAVLVVGVGFAFRRASSERAHALARAATTRNRPFFAILSKLQKVTERNNQGYTILPA